MPLTVRLPVTVRLSFTVVSEVVCPIEIGTPDVAVPIVMPFDVLEQSIVVQKLQKEILEKQERLQGDPNNTVSGQGGESNPAIQGIADQFMAIKESITGPFVELGMMVKNIGIHHNMIKKSQ